MHKNSLVIGLVLVLAVASLATADGSYLVGKRKPLEVIEGDQKVKQPCLRPHPDFQFKLPLERNSKWSLPKQALAADFADTINILVMRFNFQYEATDDPNTTGRGQIDVSRPLDTLTDEQYIEIYGHLVDPPPHDSSYFDAHMQALKFYWEQVSEQKITLTWDIYPPGPDSAYTLPQPMSYYGRCDFSEVVGGLEEYFRHGVRTADSVSPEIDFSQYESIFLFHAGSDRQNDIGFPETCNDLFTGYINYFSDDTIFVDNGSVMVRNALLMPETAVQDNRATALNAVLAHEFGHQLGLVDLYSTATFMSQLGDFALMDNNGFGSGIDFEIFSVGRVFGAIPLYPCAWSRAYLGFVDVVDFRQGTDIRLAAAEVTSQGIKVARVPISDKEYYLIENRLVDTDGQQTVSWQDRNTSVFMGPGTSGTPPFQESYLTGEYDFLMPGSGVLVYHVDERVAGLDYNYDGESNFDDNQLQWAWDINGKPVDRFITLVEADGFVNFGGYYRAGFGSEEDMFRDDRNDKITPYSNPPSIDNSGNNSHIFIENIERVWDSTGFTPVRMDSLIQFDIRTENLASGFPIRAGYPQFGISPIAADFDFPEDGVIDGIIITSGDLVSVVTTSGEDYLETFDPCGCPPYLDSSYASIHAGRLDTVPLYVKLQGDAYTTPVLCSFVDDNADKKILAIGNSGGGGAVTLYRTEDVLDDNGQADPIPGGNINVVGNPLALSFHRDATNSILYILTDSGYVFYKDSLALTPLTGVSVLPVTAETEFHGMCRINENVIVMAGNDLGTNLYVVNRDQLVDQISLGDYYSLGPIAVDLDRDGNEEIICASTDGKLIAVSADIGSPSEILSLFEEEQMSYQFRANPVAADVDNDGYADIVIGGINALYAFNRNFTLVRNYPVEINDRFPTDEVIAAPIVANFNVWSAVDIHTDRTEIAVPTGNGNINALSAYEDVFDFPLSGGELGIGSPVYLPSGHFGYLGLDGWFYLWEMDSDANPHWPMAGNDPSGSFNFDESLLGNPVVLSDLLPEERFFNYPNPAAGGETTIRYYLSQAASSVTLTIYDFTGKEITTLPGGTAGQLDNEVLWDYDDITPGVYRCKITAEFSGGTETAFTDIAIIR